MFMKVKSSLKRKGAQSERRKFKQKQLTPTRQEHQILLQVLVNLENTTKENKTVIATSPYLQFVIYLLMFSINYSTMYVTVTHTLE